MTKLLFCILFFSLFVFSLSSQTRKVQGVVRSRMDSHPIHGASVGTALIGTITNELGQFEFQLDTTIKTIQIRMMGYNDAIYEIPSTNIVIVDLEMANYLLNTLVVSSSRNEKPISESAVSISVIKTELANKINSNSASQILDRVPGIQIIDGQANIRGGSGFSYGAGSRVMLMLDDLPVLQQDAGSPNWDDLPVENVGQIEIVKGAASALYGSSAMNGIINFRSVFPTIDPYTRVNMVSKIFFKPTNHKEWWGKNGELEFPYTGFVNVIHRQKIKSVDISISSAFTTRTGYNKKDDLDAGRINALLRKRIHDRLTLSLGLNFNKGQSSNFFYWKDNGLFEGDTSSLNSSKKFRFTIDPSLIYFSKSEFKHVIRTRYYHVFNGADNNQANQSENLYGEYQFSKNFKKIGLQCIGGILMNQSWTKAKLYSDTNFIHNNIAGFIQLEKKFWKKLIFSAGLRYELYKINGPSVVGGQFVKTHISEDTILYRFGLNYKIFNSTFLRASFGQGYRFPTIAEKYISTKAGGLSIVPNPNLFAEHGYSLEFGWKQGFQFPYIEGLLDFAIFQSRYYDMMEFVLNNQLQFQSRNIGDTKIKGIEIELQTKTNFGKLEILTTGGYTFIDPSYLEFDLKGKSLPINTRDTASRGMQNAANSSSFENILKYRSKHLLRCDVQFNYKRFSGGVFFNYVSHVHAIDWLFELSLFIKGIKDYRQVHDHGYRIYDFRIAYQIKQLEFMLNLQNAFNEEYTIRPGISEAPRNLSLRVSYRIN